MEHTSHNSFLEWDSFLLLTGLFWPLWFVPQPVNLDRILLLPPSNLSCKFTPLHCSTFLYPFLGFPPAWLDLQGWVPWLGCFSSCIKSVTDTSGSSILRTCSLSLSLSLKVNHVLPGCCIPISLFFLQFYLPAHQKFISLFASCIYMITSPSNII